MAIRGRRSTRAALHRAPLEKGAKLSANDGWTGTKRHLPARRGHFKTLEFDFHTLEERLRETAFLTRGLKISIVDERGGRPLGQLPVRGRHRGLRQPI